MILSLYCITLVLPLYEQVKVVPLKEALSLPLAFDHRQIISDYIKKYHPKLQ